EVGRELDARERELERLGERLDEQRLAEAGDALEQDVTAREQRRHDALDDLGLAHDAVADLALQAIEILAEAPNGGGRLGGGGTGFDRHGARPPARGDRASARGLMSWK